MVFGCKWYQMLILTIFLISYMKLSLNHCESFGICGIK